MIPILDSLIKQFTLRLQLEPKLERFRARTPYFLVVALIVILFELPAVLILLLAQALGYHGTPDMSLQRSWLTLAACPPAFAAICALLMATGYLSGFRPFKKNWSSLSRPQLLDLVARLERAAQENDFRITWHAPDATSFVAVRNMALELSRAINDGKNFPMRLSFFTRPAHPTAPLGHLDAQLTLTNRTVIPWDTGERETCNALGTSLLNAAAAKQT